MVINYCERWVFRTRSAIGPLLPAVAEQRHKEGSDYTAVLIESDIPQCVVTMGGDLISISFFDNQGRPYLQYDFQQVSPGQVFNTRAIYRKYDGVTDKIVEGQTFLFTPEGKQVILIEDRVHNTSKQQETTGVNMEKNWDVYPAFGRYDSLCRAERS